MSDRARRVKRFERLSGSARRSSTSPRAGEITTERRPAATSPAALAFDEEGGRCVDSNSPAALDVGEDALSKRMLAQGRVGLR